MMNEKEKKNLSIERNLNRIKTLLDNFIDEYNNSENISPDDTLLLFQNIFNNNFIKKRIVEDEPYYKLKTRKYYLKDGYGIGIAEVTGPGAIGFSSNSHSGKDIYIFSEFADINVYLFKQGKRINDISLISNFAFKLIPQDIKDTD